jgi:hypothetical protein
MYDSKGGSTNGMMLNTESFHLGGGNFATNGRRLLLSTAATLFAAREGHRQL